MTKSNSDKKTRLRILGIFFVSFAIVTLFACDKIRLSYQNFQHLQDLQSSVELIPVVSHLVHELQKERGNSAAFVAANGLSFAARLKNQREKTDIALSELEQPITTTSTGAKLLYKQLGPETAALTKRLGAIRHNVETVSIDETKSNELYTELIRVFLEGIKTITRLDSGAQLTRSTTAFLAILELEELAGQERAHVSGILSSRSFLFRDRDSLQRLIARQFAYLDMFFICSEIDVQAKMHILMSGQEQQAIVEVRNKLLSESQASFTPPMTTSNWFDLATRRIGLLHAFSDNLFIAILSHTSQKTESALRSLILQIVVFIVLGTAIGLASAQTARTATRAYAKQKARSRKLREKYDNLDAASQLAVFEVDPAGRLLHANPTARNVLAKSGKRKWRGKTFSGLVPKNEKNQSERQIHLAFKGASSTCELHFSGVKNSDTFYGCFLPIYGDKEQPEKAMIIAENITGHRQNSQALLEAKTKAEASAKAKANFIANINHELRTPLNHIIGFSQLLTKETIGKRQKEWLDHVQAGAAELMNKVNSVVELASADETVDAFCFNLVDLVTSAIAREDWVKRLQSEDKSLFIDVQCPNIKAYCNSWDLERTLHHILDNAAKFTQKEANIVLQLGTAENHACITVRDNGPGIPADHIARVTKPFEILEESYTRSFGGMGLGLATSKLLLERNSGRLEITSEPGNGTVVRLIVPLAEPAILPASAAEQPSENTKKASEPCVKVPSVSAA